MDNIITLQIGYAVGVTIMLLVFFLLGELKSKIEQKRLFNIDITRNERATYLFIKEKIRW
jgi:hypothetical protein